MQAKNRKKLMLFSGSANEPLAEEVAALLGVELGKAKRSRFANGEISTGWPVIKIGPSR